MHVNIVSAKGSREKIGAFKAFVFNINVTLVLNFFLLSHESDCVRI